jgi:hypothetical protein
VFAHRHPPLTSSSAPSSPHPSFRARQLIESLCTHTATQCQQHTVHTAKPGRHATAAPRTESSALLWRITPLAIARYLSRCFHPQYFVTRTAVT